MSKHFHTLKIKQLIKETADAISIVFDVPNNLKNDFEYKAGQYLTIKAFIEGEEVRRSYSLSSSPEVDGNLKVTSKKVTNGKMSTFLYHDISVGDELEVMPPDGSFLLENTHQPAIFYAAGSGITPIISMLKEFLECGDQLAHLYYGNRAEEDIIFKQELDELRVKYPERFLLQYFRSSEGERLESPRVMSICEGLGEVKNQANFYICGPEGMIAATKDGLLKAGINAASIKIEYFASPKTESKTVSAEATGDVLDVVVIIDDEEHQVTLKEGETILDGAERIGVDPPYSCHSGVCTTCKAKLLSGEVEMENNFGLGEDEIEDGYILSCIGTPTTAGVRISWDEV